MNKKIALLINKIITESPYTHFNCDIIQNKTNGFWKVNINFKSRKDAHSESLIRLIPYLGLVYGESLCILDKGKKVEVL